MAEKKSGFTFDTLVEVPHGEKKTIRISRATDAGGEDRGIYLGEFIETKAGGFFTRNISGLEKQDLKKFIDGLVKVYKQM